MFIGIFVYIVRLKSVEVSGDSGSVLVVTLADNQGGGWLVSMVFDK